MEACILLSWSKVGVCAGPESMAPRIWQSGICGMRMKIVLGLSLAANAALMAGYFITRPAGPPATPVAEIVTNTIVRTAREDRSARSTPTVISNGLTWASVESADYRDYIAKLRAIGCPEETVRDIIIADVNKLYGSRMAALYPQASDFKFWQTQDRSRAAERDRERQLRELEREKRQLIKDLLGVDVEDELAKWRGRPDEDELRFGFLSVEKQQQLRTLQTKYQELERAVFADGGGRNPEGRAKLNALRAQREAEMAQVLGPQDYEQYQLRTSWTARNMREDLGSFEPTEWEFREIFKLRKAFDDQFRFGREGGDEAAREQRRQIQQQIDEQTRSLLGEERYAQYQLAQDERFRDVYEFTQRAELPKDMAQTLYDMQRTAEAARQQVLNDQSIAPDQRAAALAALTDETKRSLSATLGERYSDYERRAGDWVDRLSRVGRQGQRNQDPGERAREGRGRFFRR